MVIDGGALDEEALNKLGAEGWRLVALTADMDSSSNRVFTHIFIREKR